MEFGISTYGWTAQALEPALLERLGQAGFRQIELFANRPHLDYHDPGLQKNIASWFRANQVAPPSLHLPFYDRIGTGSLRWISALAPEERERLAALDEIKRALELTDRIEVSYVVIHLGIPYQIYNPVAFEHAFTLIDTIEAFAGIPILIENLDNEISTPDRILEFLKATQLEQVGICYDIGHDERPCSLPSFDRVRAIHLNDNGGDTDDHALMFDGSIQWPALVDRVVSGGFDGNLLVEARSTDLDAIRTAIGRIEDLMGEAASSIQEFRQRYSIRRAHDSDLH